MIYNKLMGGKICIKTLFKKILPFWKEYQNCQSAGILYINYPLFLKMKFFKQKHYYPIPKGCIVVHEKNIYIGYNSSVFRPGCYIQGEGSIKIGNCVQIAQNVGIVSTNHDVYDLNKKHPASIEIGDYSWIGMNSVILAGVVLGPHTIVGAGSIVTKSFSEGYVVIAGNPARIIRNLDKNIQAPSESYRFYGVLSEKDFAKFKYKYLKSEILPR